MAINFEQDRGGLLSLDTGVDYNQIAFKPGSALDNQINKLYQLEEMGYPQPNLQKLKDMDMKQFQEKGTPLSLPEDQYAMAISNYDQLFSPKTFTDASGVSRTTSGFAKPNINTLPFNVNEITPDGITNNVRFRDMLLNDLRNLPSDFRTSLGQTKDALVEDFSQLRGGLNSIKDSGMNLFEVAKDKGINLGSTILSGIGRYALGPIGGILGSLIGGLKETPTDKVGLASFGGDYDPYGFKGQLTSGTLGARQDPFGRNIVSAFGNYKQNRINELKELTQLQNLGLLKNQFKKDKLDFARNYLEKVKQEREQRQREAARKNFADVYRRADQQGFTGPGGGFDTSAADRAGTSLGSGQFSPSSSRGRSGY
jgi:hypothetical protein